MRTEITRFHLYERVWATPMRTLSKEFDISDVGLAKACRKHNIPTPAAGHWAKLAHGKTSPRAPLPQGDDVTVVLEAIRHRCASVEPILAVEKSKVASVLPEDTPELISNFSPLTFSTYSALGKAKADRDGFIRSGSSKVFNCAISTTTFSRAVRILNAIEQTFANAGISIRPSVASKHLEIELDDVHLPFLLMEKFTRTEHVYVDPKYEWHKQKTYTYQFTGELKLSIETSYNGRKTWSDGKNKKLEEKVGDFVSGMMNAAHLIREQRKEMRVRELRWLEDARLAEQVEIKTRQVNQFRANLLAEAAAWVEFKHSMDYLNHIELELATTTVKKVSNFGRQWLTQAKEIALSRDPTLARISRLQHESKFDSYYGLFGPPLVNQPR